MRLRLLVATALAVGSFVALPASAAASPAPVAVAQAKCAGLPKHSNLPVVDTARAMDPTRSAYLTGDFMRLKMETDIAIVAATVRDLGGDDIASYARRLFDCWGIGSADTDHGVLILVAMRERRVRVELGKGLANKIDPADLNAAVAAMTAPMRRGDVAGAVREAAVAIVTALGETLPDLEEFIRTNGKAGLGNLGLPPNLIPSPGATRGPLTDAPPAGADGSGDAGEAGGEDGYPTSTSPFAPSPVGDGRWIPKVVIGIVVVGFAWTFARGVTRGLGLGSGGTPWRGGFPSFGGGDRGWGDPGLLRDGRWSSDGAWLGGGGSHAVSAPPSSGWSGSSDSSGSSGSSGSSDSSSGSSSGSSSFGGGSSGGGGASGSW